MKEAVRFTDAEGLAWTVYEVPGREIVFGDELVERSSAHLTFELDARFGTILKRLREYPHNWRDLSPADLDELCTRAGPTLAGAGDSEEIRRHIDEVST